MFSFLFKSQFSLSRLCANLKITIGRIKLLRLRRGLKISSLLHATELVLTNSQSDDRQNKSHAKAFERSIDLCVQKVTAIAREEEFVENMISLEMFAKLVLEKIEHVRSENAVSKELLEAVASLIYCAKKMYANELPELVAVAKELGRKYGEGFRVACEQQPRALGVCEEFIEKELVSMRPIDRLKELATEWGLEIPAIAIVRHDSDEVTTNSDIQKKKKKSVKKKKNAADDSTSNSDNGTDIDDDDDDDDAFDAKKYSSAAKAAKAARLAANEAMEAADYAESLCAFANVETSAEVREKEVEEEEEEVNLLVQAALDEQKLEELNVPRFKAKPPPGIISSQKDFEDDADDAIASRFEALKNVKKK